MNPNCLLFSERERERQRDREREKMSRRSPVVRGWSGGAMVLGELSVLRRPTNLDIGRARAYCACSRCGWDCLDIFKFVYLFFFLPPSFGDGPI